MGFPVVLKIVSPEILHKTEAGGVIVGVRSADDVEKGFATIMANAKKYDAKAKLLGVQVQQMLAGGQEVIIGAVTDPAFGKLVAFGLGGILVEVLKDITFRLAPASREDALSMLDGIAAAEILKGVRGSDPVDREALAGLISNVSQLVADFPEIAEMDLNPVFATKNGATAADVRIVVDWNPAPRAPPAGRGGRRPRDEPDHEAGSGGGDRRVVRGRQDRQLGDEEPDQRRLQGPDLPDQPVRRRDHGDEGVQERQGRARRRSTSRCSRSRRSSSPRRSSNAARRRFPARC